MKQTDENNTNRPYSTLKIDFHTIGNPNEADDDRIFWLMMDIHSLITDFMENLTEGDSDFTFAAGE